MTGCSIFNNFAQTVGFLLELHALTLAAISYALLHVLYVAEVGMKLWSDLSLDSPPCVRVFLHLLHLVQEV